MAILLSKIIRITYVVGYSQMGAKSQGSQYLGFAVGCASVFAMVSMAARAMRMIDFMVGSIYKSGKPSSSQ